MDESDSDRYSVTILEDLLQGTSEWRSVPDIVRLSLKAFLDVVKVHSSSLLALESSLPTRASKTELQSIMTNKANVNDVHKSITNLQNLFEERLSNNYVNKENLQLLLANRPTVDYVKEQFHRSVDTSRKIEEFSIDFQKKIDGFSTKRDLELVIGKFEEKLDEKANLKETLEILESKANKQAVANAIQKKANKNDVTELEKRFEEVTERKDENELSKIIEEKINKKELKELFKKDFEDVSLALEEFKKDKKNIFERLKKEIDEIKENVEKEKQESKEFALKLDSKADLVTFKKISEENNKMFSEELFKLKSDISNFRRQTEAITNERIPEKFQLLSEENKRVTNDLKEEIRQSLEENAKMNKSISRKLQKDFQNEIQKTFHDLTESIENLKISFDKKIEDKVDLEEVQNALNACQSDISNRIIEDRTFFEERVKVGEQEMWEKMAQGIDQIKEIFDEKNLNLEKKLKEKVPTKELEALKRFLEKIIEDLNGKISFPFFEKKITFIENGLEGLKKEVLLKANIKDVCTLIDCKPNIDDVNKALSQIHSELDSKTALSEFHHFTKEQLAINESLCTETLIAKWTWMSGELSAGQSVPWETQIVNTLPDNFLWQKDKSSIMIVAQGFYEISYGFFAKKLPNISLMINGEPLILSNEKKTNLLKGKENKENVQELVKREGKPLGCSKIEFLSVNPRTRISLVYKGDVGGEGFLSIKKL